MNPNIIVILCAANFCVLPSGTAVESLFPPNEWFIAPLSKDYPQCKINIEGILVNEHEEKRRYATVIKRKDKYGYRTASPSKATLKKRNKRR